MADRDLNIQLLINEYTENYIEKIFYFCLKKTGNIHDAQDLSSDITTGILQSLNKGTIPFHFSAWIWRIARNRYSVWADNKHKRSGAVTGSDIGDYEIEADRCDIAGELIHSEDLLLLRRELAFISSDYRNIVVAYYLDDIPVKQIAAALTLPEGTVMSKLYRARKKLKEGMSMAREFGTRSYKPEEISFINSCTSFGDFGQPWTVLNHALYKNIFLEVYANPQTAEELSVQLGVALPYMEDELEYLTKQTFLLKTDAGYETAFPIISREAQDKIYKNNVGVTKKVTPMFEKMIDIFSSGCKANGINYFGKYQSYENAKWTILMRAFDLLWYDVSGVSSLEYTARPDNGRWDIVGYQETFNKEPALVGNHGTRSGRTDLPYVAFQQYKFEYHDILYKSPIFITNDEATALKMVSEGQAEECDPSTVKQLEEYGYLRKKGSEYEPTIVIFKDGGKEDYLNKFSESEKADITSFAEEIKAVFKETYDFINEVISNDLTAVFKNDERMHKFVCMNSSYSRAYVCDQAITDGWLRYDADTSDAIGAYMYI